MKKQVIKVLCVLLAITQYSQGQESLPTKLFSTYYGNTGTDDADVLAVDVEGNTYLGCHSNSSDLPGILKYPYNLAGDMDAFVVKLNNTGTEVAYLTHLGGEEWDAIQGIATDSEKNVYAVGTTYSPDFPVDKNGYQTIFGGKSDAFVVKLNPEGKVLWSTFLGGNEDEDGRGIVLDQNNRIHIVGRTASKNFPVTNHALQPQSAGGIDAFVTTLDTDGKILMSTYLGGSGDDIGFSIARDSEGKLYLGGTTNSSDFPIKNAIQKANRGEDDAFLTVLNSEGTKLQFSDYFGGSTSERLYSIGLDDSGSVFLMGVTNSEDYFTYKDGLQPEFGGVRDAFITKVDLRANKIAYSTYLGGALEENPRTLVITKKGHAIVTGETASLDFPIAHGSETPHKGNVDAFVSILNENGTSLKYSGLFGGQGQDFFEGLALGPKGSLTMSGGSNSSDFPLTSALQNTFSGGRFDIVVTRIFFDWLQ